MKNLNKLAKVGTSFNMGNNPGNKEVYLKYWQDYEITFLNYALPHGSGIDNEYRPLREESNCECVAFILPYHAMDEHGYYCGWLFFKVIISPSFQGFALDITLHEKQMDPDEDYDIDSLVDYLYDILDNAIRVYVS
jgi:hypothetical protein